MEETIGAVQSEKKSFVNVSRSVSLGEIIVAAATIIATTVTAYFSIEKRVAMLERDYKFQYETINEFKSDMKEVKQSINEIKLMLKDKQDKELLKLKS